MTNYVAGGSLPNIFIYLFTEETTSITFFSDLEYTVLSVFIIHFKMAHNPFKAWHHLDKSLFMQW